MGRISWHWRDAIQQRAHEFIHIGPADVGRIPHPACFPGLARRAYQKLHRRADVLLVHEPASGAFVGAGAPLVVFSHGIERRNWERSLADASLTDEAFSLKTRMRYPIWRLRKCDRGLRRGDRVLLTNRDDVEFARARYGRLAEDLFLFRNGIDPVPIDSTHEPSTFTVLFNATWIPRKGIGTLAKAARALHERSAPIHWLLAGTQADHDAVLRSWPEELHATTRVIPSFSRDRERALLEDASLFVLPSTYEGQPLSLLQAMAAGRCCITTDCCGQRDVVVDGQNGLLFPVGDAERLAMLIERCFQDAALRRRLGAAAQASMRDRRWADVSSDVAEWVLSA